MIYHTPDSALRRAQEFISVGQDNEALSVLETILSAKKYRHQWLPVFEDLITLYIDTTIKLRVSCKDMLYQYRNLTSSNHRLNYFEALLKKYLVSIQNLYKELHEDKNNTDKTSDISEEMRILRKIRGENLNVSNVSSKINATVRYIIESFRSVFDLCKNQESLFNLYHEAYIQAFQFCCDFNKTNEFRKLCEVLRNHYSALHNIDLNNNNVQVTYLRTRFIQLKSATTLNLWQEAYKKFEDIHNNLSLGYEFPNDLLKTYYKELAAIFKASGNILFHAYALFIVYELTLKQQDDTENILKLADTIIIAVLSIRPSKTVNNNSNIKLASILGIEKSIPTRKELVNNIINSNILQNASKTVVELFNLYNRLNNGIDITPLSFSKQSAPYLDELENDTTFKYINDYLYDLKHVLVIKIIQNLQKTFSSIKLQRFLNLVPAGITMNDIEVLLLETASNELSNIQLDHLEGLVIFNDNNIISTVFKNQLVALNQALDKISSIISSPNEKTHINEVDLYNQFKANIKSDHEQITNRMIDIENQILEKEQADLDRENKRIQDEEAKKLSKIEDERQKLKEEEEKDVLKI